jgi:hypothetical protein
MSRVASVVLLIGGAVLCVTWLVSPASSSPQTVAPPRAALAANGEAADLDVESIRLDAVAPAPRLIEPRRDPFSFQSRPTSEPRETVAPAPIVPALPPPVRLPTLVAIIKERTADRDVFRAALSNDGFNVTMVASGELFAGFVVVDVQADGLTLKQQSSGQAFVVSLR